MNVLQGHAVIVQIYKNWNAVLIVLVFNGGIKNTNLNKTFKFIKNFEFLEQYGIIA